MLWCPNRRRTSTSGPDVPWSLGTVQHFSPSRTEDMSAQFSIGEYIFFASRKSSKKGVTIHHDSSTVRSSICVVAGKRRAVVTWDKKETERRREQHTIAWWILEIQTYAYIDINWCIYLKWTIRYWRKLITGNCKCFKIIIMSESSLWMIDTPVCSLHVFSEWKYVCMLFVCI